MSCGGLHIITNFQNQQQCPSITRFTAFLWSRREGKNTPREAGQRQWSASEGLQFVFLCLPKSSGAFITRVNVADLLIFRCGVFLLPHGWCWPAQGDDEWTLLLIRIFPRSMGAFLTRNKGTGDESRWCDGQIATDRVAISLSKWILPFKWLLTAPCWEMVWGWGGRGEERVAEKDALLSRLC